MIRIDALTLLFLIQFTAICMAAATLFFLKNRKHKLLYRTALKESLTSKTALAGHGQADQAAHEHAKKTAGTAGNKAADDAKYAQILNEKEHLATKVSELEEKVRQNNIQLEEQRKKYVVLENEYSILYERHVTGQGQGDVAKDDGLAPESTSGVKIQAK